MTAVVTEAPGGHLDISRGEIRQSASAGVVLSVAQRLNWMLGYHGAGLVFSGHWESPPSTWTGNCYHRRGVNTKTAILIAVLEGSPGGGKSEFDFTPDSKTAYSYDSDTATGTDIFEGDWAVWAKVVDVSNGTDILQHQWDCTYCYLHALSLWDCPRIGLGSGDTYVDRRSGAWAGIETGRRITDSTSAGMAALLQGTRDARDKTVRHLQWCDPESAPLQHTISSASTWETISGFQLQHRARQLHSLDSWVEYTTKIKGRRGSGSGTCDIRVVSSGTGDYATSSGIGTSFSWLSPSSTQKIDSDTTDTITLQARSTQSGDVIECCGLSFVE